MDWANYNAPQALNEILNKGLRAKVAMKEFSMNDTAFSYGTIMIPVQNQNLETDEIYNLIKEISQETAVSFKTSSIGLSNSGINLGSSNFKPIEPKKVAVLVGEGITPYDAGEIWHLFDQRYEMLITKLDVKNLRQSDLSRYTDIVLPSYQGNSISKSETEKLKEWVKNGGSLIGYRSSVKWLDKNDFIKLKFKKNKKTAKNIRFEERKDFYGAERIGGSIFEVDIDRSHPIAFGYTDDRIAIFRNTKIFLGADKDSY